MKKVYLMFFAIGMVGMVACGGSHKEEKAAEATPNADSMAAAATEHMDAADSTAAPAQADSAAAEHSENH